MSIIKLDDSKKMTPTELAQMLDGAEYGLDDRKEELNLARENGLVVVYGYSDDLMEFEGAIRDEVGCYEGGKALLTADGVLNNLMDECDFHDCKFYKLAAKNAKAIKAVWCAPGSEYAWTYETDIPHSAFRVLEGGEPYCEGIVFSIDNLK